MKNIINNIEYQHFCHKNVSNIAYGCATLANIYDNFDINSYQEVILYSIKNGINYFDVAPFYGGGIAEERLGLSLKIETINRDSIFIATKLGRYTEKESTSGTSGYFDFTPSKIENSIKESMSRIEINYIDLIQCHDIENVNNKDILECLPILEHFRTIGKIGGIGINSYPIYPLCNIIEQTSIKIDSIGTYAHNTIINNSILDYIPYFSTKNIKIINSSPLAMGLLTQEGPPKWHPASPLMLEIVDKIKNYCLEENKDISNISMRYSLNNNSNEILTTITGGKNINEIKNNIESIKNPIQEKIKHNIDIISKPIKNKLWGPEDDVYPIYEWDYV